MASEEHSRSVHCCMINSRSSVSPSHKPITLQFTVIYMFCTRRMQHLTNACRRQVGEASCHCDCTARNMASLLI